MSDTLSKLIAGLSPAKRAMLAEKLRDAPEPIAVVGIGCRLPGGCDSPDALWRFLAEGRDGVTEVPAERWDVDEFYDPAPQTPGKMYTRWGSFLTGDVGAFDAGFFGISPREAARMDPQQRILLEVAWHALEDAGLPLERLAGSQTGGFIGVCANDYSFLHHPDPRQLDAYTATGNAHSIVANRLSYVFDLQGPSVAVDTACSSSLIAVHLACQSLWDKECDLALAGGVHLVLSPLATITFSNALMMSADGRCKTFDARADGFVRGEGCALVVLRRLSEAQADGDRIWALVRGSAINQDGKTNGLMAPNGISQQRVIRRALEKGGVQPGQITYAETHGTGTALGDPIEVEALAAVVGEEAADRDRCAIGSVKTNFGHLEGAAGIAGFLKAVLALRHRAIPPHLHFRELNPHISLRNTRLFIPRELTPWRPRRGKRLAGVSSFGFGGSNAHVVLEEPPEQPDNGIEETAARRGMLLAISARHREALRELARAYCESLRGGGEDQKALRDLCWSAAVRRTHHHYRLAVAGESASELCAALEAALAGELPPISAKRLRVAFIFSGQGSQWPGMGTELLERDPDFAACVERIDALVRTQAGWSIIDELRAPASRSRLAETEIAQPCVFAIQAGMVEVWRRWGLTPDAVAGHSLGEVAAAHAAGGLSLADAVSIVVHRGRTMQSGRGKMIAVERSVEETEALLNGLECEVAIAARNSPCATVLSGAGGVMEELAARLERQGVPFKPLPSPYAFHSAHMDAAQAQLSAALRNLSLTAGPIPFYSTVTGSLLDTRRLDGAYWGENVRKTVRFAAVMSALAHSGYTVFIEIGPHPVLLRPMLECLAETEERCHVVASLCRDRKEQISLLAAAAKLYAAGWTPDWKGMFGRPGRYVPLPLYPWQRERYWLDNGTRSTGPLLSRYASRPGHPLLGCRFPSAAAQVIFESQVSAGCPAFLNDHRLHGRVVIPAVVYLEMMLAAGRELWGDDPLLIQDLTIREVMIFADSEARQIQTVLTRDNDTRVSCQIFSSAPDGEDAWRLHASAVVCRGAAEDCTTGEPPQSQLARWQESCAVEAPAGALYALLESRGFRYGPSFLSIQGLWRGEDDALARVSLPEAAASNLALYRIHPALLEGCLQAMGALADRVQVTHEDVYIPIGIESLRFYGTPAGGPLWSHARLRPAPSLNPESVAGDIQIFDESGRTVAEVARLQFKRVSHNAFSAVQELAGWFYDIAWPEAPMPTPAVISGSASWLIVAENDDADALSTVFAAAETSCLIASAGLGRDAYAAKLEEAGPQLRGVLYVCGAEQQWEDNRALADQQQRACGTVLALAQAAAKNAWIHPVRLWVATRGSQDIAGEVTQSPGQSALWGLGRVIALEHPEIWGGLIDLPPQPSERDWELLCGEVRGEGGESGIAYRGGRRHVARLRPVKRRLAADGLTIKSDATYLISGGLGGLGLRTARWLVENGARNIALLGRSEPAEEQRTAIADMEQAGARVRFLRCDVARREQVREVFSILEQEMPPVAGILHTAGVLDDGVLMEQSWERFETVFGAKVYGAWNLHTEARRPLDLFVIFSSAAALMGSPGQANYAAANAFLDGLARWRRGRGLAGLSIQWGPWADIGMAARTPQSAARRESVRAIPPDVGVEALARAIRMQTSEVAVLPVVWEKFLQLFPRGQEPAMLAEIVREVRGRSGAEEAGLGAREFLAKLAEAPAPQRRGMLIDHIRTQIAAVMGMASPDEVPANRGIFELGMDSLMALELRNRLQAELGQPIPATLVFEHPTIEALSDYVLRAILRLEAPEKAEAAAPGAGNQINQLLKAITELPPEEAAALLQQKLVDSGQFSDRDVDTMLKQLMGERGLKTNG